MFQKFHTDSILTRFIKHLVETSYIPTLQCVQDGSPVVSGCNYIFEDNVVHSLVTGKFNSNDTSSYTVFEGQCTARNFHSDVSWYDSETHKQLGNYLRYLRDYHKLDLMPFYNCYSGMELTDMYLRDHNLDVITVSENLTVKDDLTVGSTVSYKLINSYSSGSVETHRVVSVPIKYDTKYTIALSCPSEVLFRAVVYNNGNVAVDKSYDATRDGMKDYYSDYLNYTFSRCFTCSFDQPLTYSVPLVDASEVFHEDTALNDKVRKELYDRQDDLYLLIQVPKNIQTSFVVIEGEVSKPFTVVNNQYCIDEGRRVKTFLPVYEHKGELLSLLRYNNTTSCAFSDRLIEYLLLNVISETETLPMNIRRIQESLCKIYPDYTDRFYSKKSLFGVWDDSIPQLIKETCKKYPNHLPNTFDQDGRINKDIEELLSNKGVYTT